MEEFAVEEDVAGCLEVRNGDRTATRATAARLTVDGEPVLFPADFKRGQEWV